ncbi:hypothetical protein [Hymenobacter cellulosilyticus]|uniref:Uncharacterized protein n=1 Tax=Hymenobacter cellulosilyticus TaxID=2932248 RepID=A0A8T9Q3C9_9BACT|nr:hypothetical protein [Hymenobacter cellulosilyticus]UOQ70961.1 hypothetical protein MUN79_20120 [Hymenobacter cellulosilyticus]
MKKLFFLLSCLLVLGSAPAWAQTSEPDIVVVRTSEQMGSSRIVVTRGKGKSTAVELPNGYSEKSMIATSEKYFELVSGLYREGYVLQSTMSNQEHYTTLLFVKPTKP